MRKKSIYITLFLLLAVVVMIIIMDWNSIFHFDNKINDYVNNEQITISEDKGNDDFTDRVMMAEETELFYKNIVNTSLKKDGIPPIENPKYLSVDDADVFLEDWDKIFVLETDEGVFAYPQKILVWHEIVNETIDGEALSITYCPLTASVIGYKGVAGKYAGNDYGTSGNLLNSNLVMYDRKSNSNIPQILGIGVDGELNGVQLETKPIIWANWIDVITYYPDAKVLSDETGFNRDYTRDPYGSYQPSEEKSYYQDGKPMFQLMNETDEIFADKKIIIGVKHLSDVIAIDPVLVEENHLINFSIGSEKAVAVYDSRLKSIRVFNAMFDNETLDFTFIDGEIFDQYNVKWSENGFNDKNEKLEPMTYFDVFWFAWYAYYPDTEILS